MDLNNDYLGPTIIQKKLSEAGLIKDVYKSMESDDLADVVTTWYRIIKQAKLVFSPESFLNKSKDQSKTYRVEGNQYLASAKYQNALISYNRALVFAPKNSREMVLAYSNRSALYHKFEIFSASIKDIETCFALGCPDDIKEKLLKRKQDCYNRIWGEKITEAVFSSQDTDKFFQIKGRKNPQIPCASAAVGVVVDDGIPSVVAVTDIEVGTVVAVETAYVSALTKGNLFYSCTYCHNIALNLFPCECCCWALYCSQDCKDKSQEYHKIENAFQGYREYHLQLSLHAAIKMRQACKSWEEFIAGTENIKSANFANHSIKEMFDSNEKFSLLFVDTEKAYFNYGIMYNNGFIIASIIANMIDQKTSFFPNATVKKDAAIRAFGRVMMKVSLYVQNLKFLAASQNAVESTLSLHGFCNRGFFSFTGKLQHSCDPNLLMVGLHKRVALVAVKPVRRGEPLTISYLHHWMQSLVPNRVKELYYYNKVCDCPVCTEKWSSSNNQPLPEALKKVWKRINFSKISDTLNVPAEASKYGKVIFETVGKLCEAPRSHEYCQVFKLLVRYLLNYQHAVTKNIILSDHEVAYHVNNN